MTEERRENRLTESDIPDLDIPEAKIPPADIPDLEIPDAVIPDPGVAPGIASDGGTGTRRGELPKPVVPDVPGPELHVPDLHVPDLDALGIDADGPALSEPRLSEPVLRATGLDMAEPGAADVHAPHSNDPDTIRRLLTTPGRWAVVGLSNNPRRAAVGVSRTIRDGLGMAIVPVSLKGDDVHGATGYTLLADIPGSVDVVDCFVNSRKVGAVVDQAIGIGAKAVWLQLGVIDEAAAARAKAAGLDVVMDACPVIEGRKLGLLG
jgi:predicted CoA-binding protein